MREVSSPCFTNMADESQCFRSPPPHPPDFAVLSFACGEFLPKPLPSDLVNEDHPHLGKHVIENLHLDHRLSVVTSEGHKVRRQKLLYCHLCGRQFGSASIAIHYRACGRKLQTAMSQLPWRRRVPTPAPPDSQEFPAPRKQSDADSMFERYNKEALRIFGMLTESQLEEMERKKRDKAARLLQRAFRGYLARRALAWERARRRAERERAAAARIERWWRAALLRKRECEARRAAARARWWRLHDWLFDRLRRRNHARRLWEELKKRLTEDAARRGAERVAELEAELARLLASLPKKKERYLLKGGGYTAAEVAGEEFAKKRAAAEGKIEELRALIAKAKARNERRFSRPVEGDA